MKNNNEKELTARNRLRRTAYTLCMVIALVLTIGLFLYEAIFPLPHCYTSTRPASTIAPLMGFSTDALVNTGDAAALDTLPGVGEVISHRIIDIRKALDGFRLPEDLLLVKGIGEKTLANIMDALDEPLIQLEE